MTGFRSSSAISGRSSVSLDTRRSASRSAALTAAGLRAGAPWWLGDSGPERIESISMSASALVRGASRAARPTGGSVAGPAGPSITSGPNIWSSVTPMAATSSPARASAVGASGSP
jgi:hypothetical protein